MTHSKVRRGTRWPTIQKPHRGSASQERGATIVEFALILPILLMLVMGVIELAMAFNRQGGLNAAAREGAREGSIPTASQGDISDRVNSALVGVPLDGAPTVTVTPNTAEPCASAASVVVEVSSLTTVSIPFWGQETYTLVGRGEFKCET